MWQVKGLSARVCKCVCVFARLMKIYNINSLHTDTRTLTRIRGFCNASVFGVNCKHVQIRIRQRMRMRIRKRMWLRLRMRLRVRVPCHAWLSTLNSRPQAKRATMLANDFNKCLVGRSDAATADSAWDWTWLWLRLWLRLQSFST